jgi:hypothetical protein
LSNAAQAFLCTMMIFKSFHFVITRKPLSYKKLQGFFVLPFEALR